MTRCGEPAAPVRAAQADYDRLSRQLDAFDEQSAALREEAQQLMLTVEQANTDIRTITEPTPAARVRSLS